MDSIKIFALGGLDEVGRDCYIIEINEDIFVLEAGATIPDKSMPGVDLIIPNYEYLIKNKSRVRGYFISHGHEHVMAALKFIYPTCPAPIYVTLTTKECIIGQASIHRIDVKKFNFQVIKPNADLVIANHSVHFFQTVHNASNSYGVAFDTDRGNIIYSCHSIIDFSTESRQFTLGYKQINKIIENKPTFFLLGPSSGVNKVGFCAPHHRLFFRLEKYFKAQKRIFFVSFWEDSFGITELMRLVNKYHKKVYCYDSYTLDLINIMKNADICDQLTNLEIVFKEDFARVKSSDLVVLLLGHGKELYGELSYLAVGRSSDTRIRIDSDDIVISNAIADESLEIDYTRAIDDVYKTGATVEWITRKKISSMIAHQGDIQTFLTLFAPTYYFPIAGDYSQILHNAFLAVNLNNGIKQNNVFVLDNGDEIFFPKGELKPKIIYKKDNEINVLPLIVDGDGVSSRMNEIVKDRLKLGVDGTVVLSTIVSKRARDMLTSPSINMMGFISLKDSEAISKGLLTIFKDEVNNSLMQKDFTFEAAKKSINDRAIRYIRKEMGREPIIYPIIEVVE